MAQTTWTAIHPDCGSSAARSGSPLATREPAPVAVKRTNAATRMTSFAGVPAYVADQESHPPRGASPA
jgi:hypothetical protein